MAARCSRLLRFSLRSLFVATAVFAILAAYPLYRVGLRKAATHEIENSGGWVSILDDDTPRQNRKQLPSFTATVRYGPDSGKPIPTWRRLIGDKTYWSIYLPVGTAESQRNRLQALFPEAEVSILLTTNPPGWPLN